MSYVRAHADFWWRRGFDWLLKYPPWMDDIGEENKVSGFRASEIAVYLIILRWRLTDLKVEEHKDFKEWRTYKEKLSEDDWKTALKQHELFMETIFALLTKHSGILFHELVDLAIDHPNRELGLAFARTLLSIYDGKEEGMLLCIDVISRVT